MFVNHTPDYTPHPRRRQWSGETARLQRPIGEQSQSERVSQKANLTPRPPLHRARGGESGLWKP
ncbi:MAG: hypothetical protein K8L91_29810, partial [Anaerolineae bacterium]|nr:hypothetical protein [Anaerolineae bacterium]